MKTIILTIFGVIISIVSYSQNPDSNDSKPKGMVFIPRGSIGNFVGTSSKTISIEGFWMSNEISNKEFRDFYEQIKRTPNDTIYWLDFSKMGSGMNQKPIPVKKLHSEIINQLMNESAWKSIPGKENYFIDSAYDNYPVVGVTYEGARYYCIWRTNQETKKLKEQGNVSSSDYRVPTEAEWEYASAFKTAEKKDKTRNALHQVMQGNKNELGLFNLTGNVSEWTSTSDNNQNKVVRGSSWHKAGDNKMRELMAPTTATSYTGFRIVRSSYDQK